MGALTRLRRYLRLPLSPGERAARDIEDELALHLDLRSEELVSEGMSPEDARREAERLFGDSEKAREELLAPARRRAEREDRRERASELGRDVRHAARGLARTPGFTVAAAVTLALGIGATTAIFSVVDAVLLEPLPLERPHELAMVWEHNLHEGAEDRNVVNPDNYLAWDAQARSFRGMAAMWGFAPRANLTGLGEPQEVQYQIADVDVFRVLGVRPVLGRDFTPEDGAGEPGSAGIAIISQSFWRSHFGGDSAVVGRTLMLNGITVEVIGVAPSDIEFLAPGVTLWMPTDFSWGTESGGRWLQVVARLAPGATTASAQREMAAVAAQRRAERPDLNANWGINVVPLEEQVKGDVRPALLVLLGAVGLLLLIACSNVANLLMVRAAARQREVAVRSALGATRLRLARELLTESLLLALLGGALGVALAFGATRALVASIPAALDVPRLDQVGVDLPVLGFAAAAAPLTGLIFGLAPMLEGSRTDLTGSLREGGRGGGTGVRGRRFRSAMVVAEVGLSLLLLIGAGLMLRSFVALNAEDTGLRGAERVLTARLSLPSARYPDAEARVAFLDRLVVEVEAVPAVEEAGVVTWLPFSPDRSVTGYYPTDRPEPPLGEEPGTGVQAVHGDYFRAMGIPLLEGRAADESDRAGAPPIAVVNRAFAERTWPGESAVGKRFVLSWGEDPEMEVVGVVGDVRERGLAEEPAPIVYVPYPQIVGFPWINLMVRARGDATALMREVTARVQQIDPELPVAQMRTMDEVVAASVVRPRLTARLMAIFAALALLLSAVGLYGVVAYTMSTRVREVGIRRALGAQGGDVVRLVLSDGLKLAALGVVVGVAAAFAGTRVLSGLLYQVRPTDPLTFATTAAFLLLVALAASALPAMRAARVEPTEALREE